MIGPSNVIMYNTGDGFQTVPDDTCIDNFNLTRQAESTSNSLNGSLTILIPIKIPFFPIKFGVNFTGTPFTKSQNITKKSIEDYDGDGFPDFLAIGYP